MQPRPAQGRVEESGKEITGTMLRLYCTRVPVPSWYDPEGRAMLLERFDLEDRRLIGYDESRLDEGVVLVITVDK
jgi:hypothetical protein